MTFSSTAPAHPHATGVAVYPALFTIPVYLFFMHKTDSITNLSHEDDAVALRQLEVLRDDPLEQFSAADAVLKVFDRFVFYRTQRHWHIAIDKPIGTTKKA